MINATTSRTSEISDFTMGSSVTRAIYDAIALQIQQYYVLTIQNIEDGIEQGVQNGFDFYKREGLQAFGDVTIEFASPVTRNMTIPRGTLFTSSKNGYDNGYYTIEPYTVLAGTNMCTITVYCNVVGTTGNIPANTIDTVQNTIDGMSEVYNEEAFLTGQDDESEADFKERFQNYIEALGRSTKQSIEYAARRVQNITGVYVDDSETGLIKVYCHDANGNLEDNDYSKVVYAIQSDEDDYVPAGIAWEVLPVDKQRVNVNVDIYVKDLGKLSDSVEDTVTTLVYNYLETRKVGEDVSLSQISRLVGNFDPYLFTDVNVYRDTTDQTSTDIDDTSNLVTNEQDSLSNINALISTAQYNTSNTAGSLIALGSDYLITVNEKAQLTNNLSMIQDNYKTDKDMVSTYGLSSSEYDKAYNNIVALFTGIIPTDDVPYQIDYSSYRETISNYYSQRTNLLNSIHDSITNRVNSYQQQLLDLQKQAFDEQHDNIAISPSQVARPGDGITILYYEAEDADATTTIPYIHVDTTSDPDDVITDDLTNDDDDDE